MALAVCPGALDGRPVAGGTMGLKDRSGDVMRELYGPSLAALDSSAIAARLILAYLGKADGPSTDWRREAARLDGRSGEGKLIVVTCHTGFLAHTGRALLVARALRAHGARVVFMGGDQTRGEDEQGRFAGLLTREGFRIYDAPSRAGVRWIMNKIQVEATWGWYRAAMIREEVQSHRRALARIADDCGARPDAIVSDLSLVGSISAELEGIPYIPILSFTWRDDAKLTLTPVEGHIVTRVALALGATGVLERMEATNKILRLLLRVWARPYNKVRRSLGLRKRRTFYDQMSGDLVLMPDFAGFKAMGITETALPIGPLTWEPRDEDMLARVDEKSADRFQAFLDSDPEKPLVYLTMGSTGSLDLFRMVIAALRDKPYRLAITTGGQFELSCLGELPSNVLAIELFPGRRILRNASVTINHGGSGSAYQALEAGVPQIMIPTHPDQQWNADLLQEEGAGIRLMRRTLNEAHIAGAVDAVLKARSAPAAGCRRGDVVSS